MFEADSGCQYRWDRAAVLCSLKAPRGSDLLFTAAAASANGVTKFRM